MTFTNHSFEDLSQVADALSEGRLTAPYSAVGLGRLGVSEPHLLAAELNSLAGKDFLPTQMAILLNEIAHERKVLIAKAAKLEMVVTGPDVREQARDTSVVVDQLFLEAQESVLVVGFALYKGDIIFRCLAQRLDTNPTLDVTLCLDISRRGTDTTKDDDIVGRYAHEFRARNWPGQRLPKVYFDPRGLISDAKNRAVLHAKCVVVDNKKALITSANPTPAAYDRNIELGVVVRGGTVPGQIASHFASLIEARILQPLALPIYP
jgi:phosphatidylserine/phosphatidylglycerophosphate/cardiolipin synthase-like enzyme